MYSTQINSKAIAKTELEPYLAAKLQQITPELKPLVGKNIVLERVGFTRNRSNTPYIVYKIENRRCCTFIKRKVFVSLIKKLLQLKYQLHETIVGITASAQGCLAVKLKTKEQYIPALYINKFLERYNQVALERISPAADCNCCDPLEMCVHQIAKVTIFLNPQILSSVAVMVEATPVLPLLHKPYCRQI